MNREACQSKVELHIKEAEEWLTTSGADYDNYRKLVRCTWFPFVQRRPANPQQAIICLQRSIEKLVKAVAFASGQYTYEEVLEKGHNSFGLCLDIYVRLAEAPLMKLFLDNVHGQIFRHTSAHLFSHDESLRRLSELETKVRPGSARKEMSEWAYELSTLPEEAVSRLVKSQLRSLRAASIGAAVLNHLPLSLQSKEGAKSRQLSSTILTALEKRGFMLSDGVKAFFDNERVSSFFDSQPEEKKLRLIKNLGNILLIAAASAAMVVLAGLTFGHATSPGYPGNPQEMGKGARRLESKSYRQPIGIAASVLSVGRLAGSVLKQSAHVIRFYAETFDVMNTDTSGLFKPESKSS